METANIFPVFGQLHGGDPTPEPSVDTLTCGRIQRKAYANDAGLFLVSPETVEQSEPEEKRTAPIKITGEVPADLATALYCLAFLAEFFNVLEPSDLRRIAEEIEARQ